MSFVRLDIACNGKFHIEYIAWIYIIINLCIATHIWNSAHDYLSIYLLTIFQIILWIKSSMIWILVLRLSFGLDLCRVFAFGTRITFMLGLIYVWIYSLTCHIVLSKYYSCFKYLLLSFVNFSPSFLLKFLITILNISYI